MIKLLKGAVFWESIFACIVFCQDSFKMYHLKYLADTVKYTLRYAAVPTLPLPPHARVNISSHRSVNRGQCNVRQSHSVPLVICANTEHSYTGIGILDFMI